MPQSVWHYWDLSHIHNFQLPRVFIVASWSGYYSNCQHLSWSTCLSHTHKKGFSPSSIAIWPHFLHGRWILAGNVISFTLSTVVWILCSWLCRADYSVIVQADEAPCFIFTWGVFCRYTIAPLNCTECWKEEYSETHRWWSWGYLIGLSYAN